MLITALFLAQTALAAPPLDSVIGDWDLGPNTSALRISQKDAQSIFVQFCDRATLLNTHVCNASVIMYFIFSTPAGDFTHDDNGGQHLHATLQADPKDPTVIYYDFTSDSGTGKLIGKKI
jgi:hypothetical protein